MVEWRGVANDWRRGAAAALMAAASMLGPLPAAAAGISEGTTAPGATVDELLDLARQMSPDVSAAALETAAALARVDAAGRLPDPKFRTEFKDMVRQRNSALPDELGRVEYRIEQDVPLWGKLGLEEAVARSRADAARQSQRGVELEVAAQIKAAFARSFAAIEGRRLTQQLLDTMTTLAEVSQGRYVQGLAEQSDVLRAELEKTRLKGELVRFETEQRQAAAQLNALLDRSAEAPLAEPTELRTIPDPQPSLDVLIDRAQRDNPSVGALQSEVAAAQGDAALVRRRWYPDVTLGVTFQQFVDQDGRSPGYEAMIGTEIPLQWGLRQAQEREARATLAAKRYRRDAADANVRGDLASTYWALDGARRIADLVREVELPQSFLALEAELRAYEQGRTDATTVIEVEQRVVESVLRLLNAEVEAQVRLADIERLIGGDL